LAKPGGPPAKLEERLQLPRGLPGAGTTFNLPPREAPEEVKKKAIQQLFPALEPLPPAPKAQLGPNGMPLTLAELEQLAMANSPTLRQAAADVESAKGAAKQAGAYPNPNFGYEADNVGSAGTAGFQGFFIEQVIKTAGKLKVAQASALMNLLNAQLAFRKAQTDLMTQVRGGYFAVLVARKNMQLNEDLAEFNERLYGVFYDQLRGGVLAGYEPLQLRAFTNQARTTLINARNRYVSGWKQLAAALGLPDMPLTELDGDPAEMAIPFFDAAEARARVLTGHTDILTARNTLQRARYDLQSAQIAPIPDVDVRVAVQKDYTTPPFDIANNVQVGVPLPVWDRNKGNIQQAQGALLRATEEQHRVASDLSTRLADAFERYDTNRKLVQYYRDWVLPDISVVYSRSVSRYAGQPLADTTVASIDFITHQQLYTTALATYASALRDQWQAVVDVANLLQIDNLFLGMQSGPNQSPCQLAPTLPCGHPCNSLLGALAPGGPTSSAPASSGPEGQSVRQLPDAADLTRSAASQTAREK
jgi:cobalt-zinc-cadmium efflux system outer membrane protein